MRKTKIICTIGPSSANEQVLTEMCLNGMNVARLNFSHGTHKEHAENIALIKKVREKLDLPIAIILDTRGPEYRIGTFKDEQVNVKTGAKFTFTIRDIVGDETCVSVSHKLLPQDVMPGDRILVNNGMVVFETESVTATDVTCNVITGGVLSDRKSMSFPNKTLSGEYLSEQDKKDLLFGIEQGVDFIAASFVSKKQDVIDLSNFLSAHGGGDIDIVAKIENRSGVNNIEKICEGCDGIMVARGDLGVEIPFVEVPAIQKYLITKCRMLGKRVITATEMLESMINNPRPTRAEVSDVANAVYDGSSAIMLSGETAAGKYPVEAVRSMADIAEYTESQINYQEFFHRAEFHIKNNLDAISHATCSMACDVNAKAIVVCSISGMTARMVSRFRCPVDIIGMTIDRKVWRRLSLSWGVTPVMSKEFNSTDVMFYYGFENTIKTLQLEKGDNVVLTGGMIGGPQGNTNIIKVETVQ